MGYRKGEQVDHAVSVYPVKFKDTLDMGDFINFRFEQVDIKLRAKGAEGIEKQHDNTMSFPIRPQGTSFSLMCLRMPKEMVKELLKEIDVIQGTDS